MLFLVRIMFNICKTPERIFVECGVRILLRCLQRVARGKKVKGTAIRFDLAILCLLLVVLKL